jgi:hypothetical protein
MQGYRFLNVENVIDYHFIQPLKAYPIAIQNTNTCAPANFFPTKKSKNQGAIDDMLKAREIMK